MRNEYPREDAIRKSFISLDEKWDFDFDPNNVGHKEKWFMEHNFTKQIEVPFCPESKLSGICDTNYHDHVWYQKEISFPHLSEDERLILNFEGVDYYCEVFINSFMIGSHFGSAGCFKFDITDYLRNDKNILTVYCFDPGKDTTILRGKQDWEEKSHIIWYTRTTGIYKPVWLQVVNKYHINHFYITTDINNLIVSVELESTLGEGTVEFKIADKNGKSLQFPYEIKNCKQHFDLKLDEKFVDGRLWDLENPNLFDLYIVLKDTKGKEVDEVKTYFGLREVSTKDTYVLLNGKKVYQKLVLNQSYFKDGILTPPSFKDMENDIMYMKEMGFNGCRIHQKVADPHFLYLCDKLGFLIWQECAAGYGYTNYSPRRLLNEWIDIVKNNFNHPCIICYTPLNESWGVEGIPESKQMQAHALSVYYLIKSLDQTRLVISNDGWEQCKTDLLTVHDYQHGKTKDDPDFARFCRCLKERNSILSKECIGRHIINPGYKDENQPILLTEFGGIAFIKDSHGNCWGYTTCKDEEDYVNELKRIYKAIADSNCIRGICYTQLTDVEQEVNGLMTYERKFKVKPEIIKEINDSLK